MNSKLWLILFLICACANIVGEATHIAKLAAVSKPFLMPLLGIFAFFKAKEIGVALPKALIGALIFSFLGDVILMTGAFVFGLVAFLIGHCFYIALNLHGQPTFRKDPIAIAIMLAHLGISTMVLTKVAAGSPAMLVPVALYSTILSVLFYTGLMAQATLPKNLGWTLMLGIGLFIFSDAVIGFNRFVKPFEASGLVIMATYIAAQYLLVTANLARQKPLIARSFANQ